MAELSYLDKLFAFVPRSFSLATFDAFKAVWTYTGCGKILVCYLTRDSEESSVIPGLHIASMSGGTDESYAQYMQDLYRSVLGE